MTTNTLFGHQHIQMVKFFSDFYIFLGERSEKNIKFNTQTFVGVILDHWFDGQRGFKPELFCKGVFFPIYSLNLGLDSKWETNELKLDTVA